MSTFYHNKEFPNILIYNLYIFLILDFYYFFSDRIPNHSFEFHTMAGGNEVLFARHSPGRVAQVGGQELRRR